MAAAMALQKTVFERLNGDAALTALLGENGIFDKNPSATDPPYLVFGDHTTAEWNADSVDGSQHDFSLEIWSSQNGRKQVIEIADAVITSLADLTNTDAPYQLANLEHSSTAITRENRNGFYLGVIRFRAAIEHAA